MAPSDFADRKGSLRLVGLPVDSLADTALVIKVEFDGPPDGPPNSNDDLYSRFPLERFVVDGRDCLLVAPLKAAPGTPWIWRTEFFGAFAQADVALVERGFHLAYMDVQNMYGAPVALDHMDRFYDSLLKVYHLPPKPVLERASAGADSSLSTGRRDTRTAWPPSTSMPRCAISRAGPVGKAEAPVRPRTGRD